jgi:hypothetical protein
MSYRPLKDLKKKDVPFPSGIVNARFSDWKYTREGSFVLSYHGHYMFSWYSNGKKTERQASPGYEPVEIFDENGDRWSVYQDDE